MPVSRAQLQAQLNNLEAAIGGLIALHPDDFFVAFAGAADDIVDLAATGEDRCWVEDQAMAMLERRGLVEPAPSEG